MNPRKFENRGIDMNNQFKKGVLDLCVLTILKKGDSYGYDVADTLSGKIQVSDGTVNDYFSFPHKTSI